MSLHYSEVIFNFPNEDQTTTDIEEKPESTELLKKYLLDRDWRAAETLLTSSDYSDNCNYHFEDVEFGTVTPLELLIICNQPDLIELLLPRTNNIVLKNEKNSSLNYLIRKSGIRLSNVSRITSKFARVKRPYYHATYLSDLANAIFEANAEIVKDHLTPKMNVETGGQFSRTYLQLAAISGHNDICELFLDHERISASISASDNLGTGTAFNIALRLGYAHVVDLLLAHKPVLDTINDIALGTNLTYLALAVTLLHVDVVQVLLKHGADVNIASPRTLLQTVLSKESWLRAQYFASTFDIERIVLMLTQAGAPDEGLTDEQRELLQQILQRHQMTPETVHSSLIKAGAYHLDIIIDHQDIMNVIFDKLYLREFAIFIRTSKSIRRAAEQYHAWKKDFRIHYKPKYHESYHSFAPQTIWTRAQHLTVRSVRDDYDISFVTQFQQLRSLDISSTSLSTELLQSILVQCPHLHTLKVMSMPLFLNDTSFCATNLTCLKIYNSAPQTTINMFNTMPNIKRLRLTLASSDVDFYLNAVNSIQQHCPALRQLRISTYGCNPAVITEEQLNNFVNLESLDFEFNSHSLEHVVNNCTNLTRLGISGTGEVSDSLNRSDIALQLTQLVSLKLDQGPSHVMSDEFVAKLLRGSKLRKLNCERNCSANIFEILSQYNGDLITLKYFAHIVPENISSKLPLRAFSGVKKLHLTTITPQQFYMILDTCPKLEDVYVAYENTEDPTLGQMDLGQIFSRARNLKKLNIKATCHQSDFGELVMAPNLCTLMFEFSGCMSSLNSDALLLYLAQCCPMLERLKLPYSLLFSQAVAVYWRKYFLKLEGIECSSWNDIEPWIRDERTNGVKTNYNFVFK